MTLLTLLYILNILGTAAFSISGALSAIRKQMDLLGVVMLGFLVGLGGGTIRSLCLGMTPVFWLTDDNYLWATLLPALLTFLIVWFFRLKNFKEERLSKKMRNSLRHLFLVVDAFGLGLFSIVGTEAALALHIPAIGAIFMGMTTAIGGGIIRDILCNEVPLVLQREIYATAGMIGACAYILMLPYLGKTGLNIGISVVLIIAIRMISVYRNWNTPKIEATRC